MTQSKSYAINEIPSVSGGTPNGSKLTNTGKRFRKKLITELSLENKDFISVYKRFRKNKLLKIKDFSVEDIIQMHLLVYNMRNKSTNYYDPNTETIVFKKSEKNVLPFESLKGATKLKKKEMKIEVNLEEDNSIVQPSHYERYKIEPINFIMINDLSFWIGNIVKYVVRAGYKEGVDEVSDLLKARRYIDMRLNQLEGKNPNELRNK